MGDTPRTFPLRVNQRWLDEIDTYRHKHESKHDFILKAVEDLKNKRKEGK